VVIFTVECPLRTYGSKIVLTSSSVNAFFKGLDAEKVNQIRKRSASAAGVENVIRELQKVIHDRFNDFSPVGLDQWVKDNSGRYNVFAKAFVEVVEIKIRDTVFAELQMIYGDKWWRDGVKNRNPKSSIGETDRAEI